MNNLLKLLKYSNNAIIKRTFLSHAYYCNEVWNQRLSQSFTGSVNIDELYQDLDQRYQKTGLLSAVDVDILVNSTSDDIYTDELLDIVHKLRLTAETSNTLPSTPHAIVRYLLHNDKKQDLLNILDDRLNYGVFIDYYTANILLDTFYKSKDYSAGARVASQLMLQEETEHKLSKYLSLLHCYNYLLKPEGWEPPAAPEEPEDEVKIRVKYLRNPYDDEHFDLQDPKMIVGKTLAAFTKNDDDVLNTSLHILGLILFNKPEEAKKILQKTSGFYKPVYSLIPDDSELKPLVEKLKLEDVNVNELLTAKINEAERELAEKDVANQCNLYSQWEKLRFDAFEHQKQRLIKEKRLANVEETQKELKNKEEKLWFFEKEEQIELDIEGKIIYYPKRYFGKKKKPRKIDAGYVPPEV